MKITRLTTNQFAICNLHFSIFNIRPFASYMRFISRFVAVCFVVMCFALVPTIRAQDELRAAWAISNYDITVAGMGGDRALNARATITARNVGRGAGSTLTVRINSTAEIKSVTVGSATATSQSRAE